MELQQQTLFMTPPSVELKELKNLFFQLSSKACNLQCKYCYIEKNPYKNEDDFLNIEKIKQTLSLIKNIRLNSIYLTGGEPLLHPDFNHILRMCLKFSNVTILTNGTMINDKKARFLRKIDDESEFETIYRISLDSVNELENDKYRGRGNFRKALGAISSLIKYEFNPIISVVNYNNKSRDEIFYEFKNYFDKRGFILENINLKIIPYFDISNKHSEIKIDENINYNNLDCYNSRVVAQTGVYACPVLVNDYRARMGSNINDCSNKKYLDCEKCMTCINNNYKAMVNDWM
jgi:sulfatase maturation enzyme AslB (radical SAM superfamily)